MRDSSYDTHASKGALTHPDAHKCAPWVYAPAL